jgi:glutamyl-tRNA synthetase
MLTRFAPSPTGFLHIGNVRTALICYLLAKKQGGKLLLRIDDTDTERSKEEYVDAIKVDLEWLGINWDMFARQSERIANYNAAIEKLKSAGRLYPCYETEQELEIKRKMQLSRGAPPIYDREGLKLTDTKRKELEAQGKKPHWRFELKGEIRSWIDDIKGTVKYDLSNLSDPILVREDGTFTYMLPSVVDDGDFQITHVVRGEDHLTNTAVQIQLFEALDYLGKNKIPLSFAHIALIKTAEGKLSKRLGSANVQGLREAGMEPMAINSFLAKVGTSDPVEMRATMAELVAEFDVNKFNRAPTLYALEDIERLNSKLVHTMPFDKALPKLKALGLTGVDEAFWLSVRANLEHIEDVKEWWNICREQMKNAVDEKDFALEAAALLPEGKWDETTWGQWTKAVTEKTGRKGKELFMPIRKALTGMEHGPELKVLLPLIGRERAEKRLKGEAA